MLDCHAASPRLAMTKEVVTIDIKIATIFEYYARNDGEKARNTDSSASPLNDNGRVASPFV